jgi:Zn-dependent peptidase ImmA (M78 family)/DNA-binding XRE family transcriptional regulator
MNPRPGFTPARLTQAREALGLSQTELAESLNLTPASISAYEQGSRTPSPEVLDNVALHLKQPTYFFSLPAPRSNDRVVFYRSYTTATRLARRRAQARMSLLWDVVDRLRQFVALPSLNLPKVGLLPSHPERITDEMIEAAAAIAREHWKLGELPVPNLTWLLEESGAILIRHDLDTDRMEALSEWRVEDRRPYFILNTVRRNAFRSRADLAHELGHILLHTGVTETMLQDKALFKLIEYQAWKFAQEFLLPRRAFLRDVYSLNLDALRVLKPKWKVSIAFMLHRIHSIGILDDEKYTNYRKYLAQRDWLKVEPYDAETEPERPLLLKQALEFIVDQKVQRREQLSLAIGMNLELLEELTHVEPGFFTEENRSRPFNLKLTPKKNAG